MNPRVLTSLTLLVLRQINPLHYNFFKKRGVNERLCIEEVVVDLELCVHAHGPDVELIMEAPHKNNYFFGTSSSCIYELILCNHGDQFIDTR